MNTEIANLLEDFDEQTKQRFHLLREIIFESTSETIEEKLWAKLPSFYVGENVVRLIVFKDHINVQAIAVISHKNELAEYKITPKGMLQIFHNQPVPSALLKVMFRETLASNATK